MPLLKPVFISATTISDAWFQSLFNLLEHGRPFRIDEGSNEQDYRLEFDYVMLHLTHPEVRPFEPHLNPTLGIPDPVEPGYIFGDDMNFKGEPYVNYIMSDNRKPNEDYTYGQRLTAARSVPQGFQFDQVQHVIDKYKTGKIRNNQLCLQVADPLDMLLKDPPCLRLIDTRVQDGKLHFFPYFRSWDLWGGLPANLAGIQVLKEYMAVEIGIEPGETIVTSKGLHLYKYTWALAAALRQADGILDKFLEQIKA